MQGYEPIERFSERYIGGSLGLRVSRDNYGHAPRRPSVGAGRDCPPGGQGGTNSTLAPACEGAAEITQLTYASPDEFPARSEGSGKGRPVRRQDRFTRRGVHSPGTER